MAGMNCSFCGKGFSKGEHKRRHERSHTGHRPFVCKQCKRAFTRQDSLVRHQKVHAPSVQDISGLVDSPTSPGDVQADHQAPLPPTPASPHQPQHQQHHAPLQQHVRPPHFDPAREVANFEPADGNMASIGVPSYQPTDTETSALSGNGGLSDLDLNLIWPDSQDLFQSILAADLSTTWQFPPGTLPLPSAEPMPVNAAYQPPDFSAGERLPTHRDVVVGDNRGAVQGVSRLVSNFSHSLTSAVESCSITSVFLDECLHMFFDRFIPIFPIMHRPTFVYRDCSHHLLLNAIAIGSLYLGPNDSVAKGEILWHLAHTAIATSWQSLITHKGPYDSCPGVQLVLSAVLSVIYGALSKDTGIRGASQALHSSAFFWGKQCGIVDTEPYNIGDLPLMTASREQKTYQWKIWVATEIQQRALLSHYVIDGLIAHMLGSSTSTRHTLNTMKLPQSEAAFHETTVDQWLRRMHSIRHETVSFRDVYRHLFVLRRELWPINEGCSIFALSVLLEGLQSMIADSDPDDGAIINPPTRLETANALLWLHQQISRSPDVADVARLEVLLRWHAVCLEAVTKTPQLCKCLCSKWQAHQNLWPHNNLRNRTFDIHKLVNSPEGRKALLHAVAIQDIVEQQPQGRAHVVHMPSSLLSAAIIYGIFCYTGRTKTRLLKFVDWNDVVLPIDQAGQGGRSGTKQFICDDVLPSEPAAIMARNLSYELNSIQKLFRCLQTQWGVAADMERVISQWIANCHL